MLKVGPASAHWDVFNRTERLALLRMLPAHVGCGEVGWASPLGEEGNQWAKLNPLIQHALLQLDWEFAIGRRLKGFSEQ